MNKVVDGGLSPFHPLPSLPPAVSLLPYLSGFAHAKFFLFPSLLSPLPSFPTALLPCPPHEQVTKSLLSQVFTDK